MTDKRDLLSLLNYSSEEFYQLISRAIRFKNEPGPHDRELLAQKSVALIFNKPSTRTRISFEAAIAQLGGHSIYMSGNDLQLGRGETIEDTGKVLSRYVDAIVIRTFAHVDILGLAAAADIPVVNALTDDHHPCQVLADLMTVMEKKSRLAGVKMAYIGDGNNVCHSLLIGAAKTGMDFTAACPPGYEPRSDIIIQAEEAASAAARVRVVNDPAEAARGADVLYTDVWTSMGQEEESARRLRDFAGFQITPALLAQADSRAIVMHCLPAHRGEEITAEVIDGPQSVVFDQAENRLHIQKAILAMLVGRE